MKCPVCGRIVRKVNGELITHPCKTARRRAGRAGSDASWRQAKRYYDLDGRPESDEDR